MSCPFHHLSKIIPSSSSSSSPHPLSRDCPTFHNLVAHLQSSPDAAFLLSREGTILYRNRAAGLLFLSDVENLPLTSLFDFSSSWDELAADLQSSSSSSRPRYHDAEVNEADGTVLAFRVGLARLSEESRRCEQHSGEEEGKEVFACAYVTPLHDHQDEETASRGCGDYTIREEEEEEANGEEEGDVDDDDEIKKKERFRSPLITERQRQILEGQDRDLADHMRDIVQSSLDPMLSLFENGIIWMANDRTTEVFGYAPEELVGRNIAEICPQAVHVDDNHDNSNHDNNNHDNNDNVNNNSPIATVKRTNSNDDETTLGRIKHATVKHRRDAAKLLPVELGISRLPPSSLLSSATSREPIYFAHIKDLSQLHAHRDQIAHKDELCQAMIDASFDPMFGIDQRGKILVCNVAACSMFGYSREEFLGKNISVICNERDAPHHEEHMARYVRTGEKRVIGRKRPLVARRKDGSQFHIELGVSEVDLRNGEKMFCGYVRDMTQQRLDKLNLRKKEAVIHEKFFHNKLGMPQEEAEKLGEGKRREILRGQRKVDSLPGGILGDEC